MRNEQILLAVDAVRHEDHGSIASALDAVERYLLDGMIHSSEWHEGELARLRTRLAELEDD